MCGRKELWENGPSGYKGADDLVPEAGRTSNEGRKFKIRVCNRKFNCGTGRFSCPFFEYYCGIKQSRL
jgi:hypothetical protein